MINESPISKSTPTDSEDLVDLVDETSGDFETIQPRMGEVEMTKFLCSLNEFSQVPLSEVTPLARSSRLITLNSGQCITNEGDEGSANGFIVVSGCVSMVKTSHSGKELIVELLQAGDIFGMLLMLVKERLPAELTARSIGVSRLLLVPLNSFQHLLHTNTDLFKGFVAHLLLSLQASYCLARGLAYDRVETRIAAVLSSLNLKLGKPQSRKVSRSIYFTRQQLAELTGTTPETAIRVTRAMQRDGLIDITRPGIIRVKDPVRLDELAIA